MIGWVVLRNLRSQLLGALLTAVVVAVASTLALAVPMLLRQVDRGASDAVQVFDLLVAAKGSPVQAVLSSLFYLDVPVGNLPLERFEELRDDPRTARAVPIGLGDSFRGFPVVGTDEGFFALRQSGDAEPYFRVARGRAFDGPFEAVIGARVAHAAGLALGDHFETTHGHAHDDLPHEATPGHGHGHGHGHEHEHEHDVHAEIRRVQALIAAEGAEAPHPDSGRSLRDELARLHEAAGAGDGDWREGLVHAEEYEVVGILAPTGGPVDGAVLVDIESVWLVHGQLSPERRQVTAVLYSAERLADFYSVAQEINDGPDAQAVFTGAVFAQIRSYLLYGQEAYRLASYLVLALAALTVALYVLSGALERRRRVALLRALGASRALVFGTVLLETLVPTVAGVLAGVAATYALGLAGSGMVGAWLGFSLPAPALEWGWLAAVAMLVPLAVVVALVPAWRASRVSPLEHL